MLKAFVKMLQFINNSANNKEMVDIFQEQWALTEKKLIRVY